MEKVTFIIADTIHVDYRATALSIMKRMGIAECKGTDGKTYTQEYFESVIINHKKSEL